MNVFFDKSNIGHAPFWIMAITNRNPNYLPFLDMLVLNADLLY